MAAASGVGRRGFLMGVSTLAVAAPRPGLAAAAVEPIDPQPYFASVKRAVEGIATIGQPIASADARRIAELASESDSAAVAAAEGILNRYTLAKVTLDKAGIGAASLGGADRVLIEQGWKSFLVRVSNPAQLGQRLDALTGELPGRMSQPNLEEKAGLRDTLFTAPLIEKLWLLAQLQDSQPLSGATVEYRLLNVFSRDRGAKSGKIGFGAAGTVNINGRSFSRAAWSFYKSPLTFDASATSTSDVGLSILDGGVGCMASLVIRDDQGHVYPPQVMRLAPDMVFQPHIYRADGETVRLPDGEYSVTSWRGPEYLRQLQTVRITPAHRQISIALDRWIDPARWGWYSGDTHIHAAGCAHYMHPTEGVNPETMIRHVRGEALCIGEVLTWGPAWDHQKRFFTGHAISPEAGLEYPELQAANNASLKPKPTAKDGESLLRYDVEVSRFPSSLSGHLVLLRLKEQDFPGTKSIEDWPSWNLPILLWARKQGALVGYAHCGIGMAVATDALPNYDIPPFDSIGANEAIVDITHDACDFLSGCEAEPATELNTWYHLLNCGFRPAMLGETDYPCITDQRPGLGRSYVQLDQRPNGDVGFNAWLQGVRSGRLYCGDGRSHFLEFAVDGRRSGETLDLERAATVAVTATVAARLEPAPTDETREIVAGWNVERARIEDTRTVPLELIVNGQAVDRMEFPADGEAHTLAFKTPIARSSWIALRILPSGHTHPVFIAVAGKPIRASKRSAQWLRTCVDALWQEKHRLIRDTERASASEAYDHARRTYERIIAESEAA